ncbi:hypothetical protein TNCV_922441 [Trichonephila clavipes]|nr:hypothetical protein TNCV_922441 [Trichonephila clavipes]
MTFLELQENFMEEITEPKANEEVLQQLKICYFMLHYAMDGSIAYVYGSKQKDLFKRLFRFLPVVVVLESPCFKNIPEPMDCKIILKGHRNFHDQKLPLACFFNKAYGYARLCKVKISAFEDSEKISSSESEEECNN